MPRQLADLGDLLTALRINGVSVGPGEVARLQQVFALQPELDRDGLKHVLSALLIKTPAQREVFEPLFADWCPEHEAEWPDEPAPATPSPPSPALPLPEPPQDVEPDEPKSARRLWVFALGIALLCTLLIWWRQPEQPEVLQPPVLKPSTLSSPPKRTVLPNELHDWPVAKVWFWQAAIDEKNIVTPWRLSLMELALLGLAAWAAAAAMWWRYHQRFPNIAPLLYRDVGRRRQPLPPPNRDDSALTVVRERRQMVWRIEQFVSEDSTHRLDLPTTVDATARAGGFIELHFEPAVYDREIWFWQDRQLDRETPQDAIDQLCAALVAGGLAARKGRFTDVPDRIDWPEQSGYRPDHEEGHGHQAIVAILTDGEGLANRLGSIRYQLVTERLLRHLRHWPRLCFVDCSASGTRLEGLLGKYGIETIALPDLPQWLGGTVTRTQAATPLGDAFYGDKRVWVAALALGDKDVSRAGAQSLRVALELSCSPWLVDDVMEVARQSGAAQVDWLMCNATLTPRGTPTPDSMAYRALAWWVQRYAEAEQQRHAQENPLLLWADSLASRRWQVSQAVLHLYLDPDGAAERLLELAHGDLKDEIRSRLADYAGAEHRELGGRRHMRYMTWRLADQTDVTRHRLRNLGFAAGVVGTETVAPLKTPSRLMLAGTTLVMLGLMAFGVAGYRWLVPEPPELILDDAYSFSKHPAFKAQTVQLIESVGRRTFEVTLGSSRHTVSLTSQSGARIPVTWAWREHPNVSELEGSVMLNAGRLAQPIRACSENWPKRSLAVIATPFEGTEHSKAARQLAIRLLDKGSADAVLLGTQWQRALPTWLGASRAINRETQVLVILPQGADADLASRRLKGHPGAWAVGSSGDFAALARGIRGGDSEAIADVLPGLEVHRQRRTVRVSGGPKQMGPDRNGIEWVRVCPGTFTMGTIDRNEDRMAFGNEIVAAPRTMVISGFDMALTGTTEMQYGGRGLLPQVVITWKEARNFCRQNISDGDLPDGDLPTEAQWEYAARGGSRFPWSFGDDEGLLAQYGNYSSDLVQVKQKLPNPLGLYDMHGNVWEWTRDVYSEYTSGVFVDPPEADDGNCQFVNDVFCVVRGGSFVSSPVYLRSARRARSRPEVRSILQGFRCVRVPPAF